MQRPQAECSRVWVQLQLMVDRWRLQAVTDGRQVRRMSTKYCYILVSAFKIGQYFGLTTGGVLMGRQQRGSVDQTDIPRCSAVKCSVNNDCQFKLDSLRCSQPVKTGTTDRRRPATDRAAALRTDRRRLNGFLPRPASVELPLSSHSIRTPTSIWNTDDGTDRRMIRSCRETAKQPLNMPRSYAVIAF